MRIINLLGVGLFPLSLCLLLPVFTYNIVLEKEQKLIEIMKMNGMRMKNYWMVQFCFNFILYFITVVIFFLFGWLVLGLSWFSQTNILVLILFFVAWGFAQICLAFFFSVLMNKAQTASIIGYLLSIWVTLTAITFNATLYSYPEEVSWWLMLYPNFPYTRFLYLTAYHCAYGQCNSTIASFDWEAWKCIILLFTEGLIVGVLALYLNEIVPQTYGVPKHPFFPCRDYICKKPKRNVEELDELEEARTPSDFDAS